jgi:cysteine-rich repeat protein
MPEFGEQCDDGNGIDTDDCTNMCTIAVCGDGIVWVGEECDDANNIFNDTCNNCVLPVCGDGLVAVGAEDCDDQNLVQTDACLNDCSAASCGDGIVWTGIEACDDADFDEFDECSSICLPPGCGDGFLGMDEICDDGNSSNNDNCVLGCVLPFCGDGFTHFGVEQCDDADLDDTDSCNADCTSNLGTDLLLCGFSSRNIADFIPMGVDLTVIESCEPDENTQALVITRNALNLFDNATVQAYVENGGVVLTEYSISDTVFNAVFGTNVVDGNNNGSCQDTAPTVVQFTANDPFWTANAFEMIDLGMAGCGRSVANFPEIVPLAGWSAVDVAIGYRNFGAGRLWLTDFDWSDGEMIQPYEYTEQLMGSMIITSG